MVPTDVQVGSYVAGWMFNRSEPRADSREKQNPGRQPGPQQDLILGPRPAKCSPSPRLAPDQTAAGVENEILAVLVNVCRGDVTHRAARLPVAVHVTTILVCFSPQANISLTFVCDGYRDLGRPRPLPHLPRRRIGLDAFASRGRTSTCSGSAWCSSSVYVFQVVRICQG